MMNLCLPFVIRVAAVLSHGRVLRDRAWRRAMSHLAVLASVVARRTLEPLLIEVSVFLGLELDDRDPSLFTIPDRP